MFAAHDIAPMGSSQSLSSFGVRQLRHEIVHHAIFPQFGDGTEVDMSSTVAVGQMCEPSARRCAAFADRPQR